MAISVLSIPCGTVKRTCIAITSVWFFGFTLNAISFSLDNEDLPKLWVSFGTLTGLFPIVNVFYRYGKLWKLRITSRGESLPQRTASRFSPETKSARKLTKTSIPTTAIVVLVAVFLSTPVSAVSILEIGTNDRCRRRLYNRAWIWCVSLFFSSSAVYPWIYAMRLGDFIASLKRTFHLNIRVWRMHRARVACRLSK